MGRGRLKEVVIRVFLLGFLLVVPGLRWGQFPTPPDDAGELVLAHEPVVLPTPDGGPGFVPHN